MSLLMSIINAMHCIYWKLVIFFPLQRKYKADRKTKVNTKKETYSWKLLCLSHKYWVLEAPCAVICGLQKISPCLRTFEVCHIVIVKGENNQLSRGGIELADKHSALLHNHDWFHEYFPWRCLLRAPLNPPIHRARVSGPERCHVENSQQYIA